MSPKEVLILIGGDGHCRSCIDVIEIDGRFAIRGIVDEKEALDPALTDYVLLGRAARVRVLQDFSDKAMRTAIYRVYMEGLAGPNWTSSQSEKALNIRPVPRG